VLFISESGNGCKEPSLLILSAIKEPKMLMLHVAGLKPCNIDAGQSTPFGFPLLICTKTVYLEHWTRRSRAHLTSKPKCEPFWQEFKATWQEKNQNLL
jgi:hypothetical protein